MEEEGHRRGNGEKTEKHHETGEYGELPHSRNLGREGLKYSQRGVKTWLESSCNTVSKIQSERG